MTEPIEFEINDLPKTPNALLGSHWKSRSSHAKKWKRLVAIAVNRIKPTQPFTSATLTLTRVSSMEADFDGLSGSFKAVIDGLVNCGVIVDDTPEVIGQPKYLWEKGSPGKGKIIVRIEENCPGQSSRN